VQNYSFRVLGSFSVDRSFPSFASCLEKTLSLRFDGVIKSFPDKQKLREFITTKPTLQQMLKELLQAGSKRRKRSIYRK